MCSLVEESEDLATSVTRASLLVVHDAQRGGKNHKAKLTGGKNVLHPLLILLGVAVESGADSAALVQATIEVHNDLTSAVVIDQLEGADVTVPLHHLQKLHHNLGGWANEHLTLAAALRTSNGAESVSQNAHHGHFQTALLQPENGNQNG